jgi:hypothetical protein
MITKPCKTKIKYLIRKHGRAGLGKELSISERYIYYLEAGRKPGGRLYRDICELYDKE